MAYKSNLLAKYPFLSIYSRVRALTVLTDLLD